MNLPNNSGNRQVGEALASKDWALGFNGKFIQNSPKAAGVMGIIE